MHSEPCVLLNNLPKVLQFIYRSDEVEGGVPELPLELRALFKTLAQYFGKIRIGHNEALRELRDLLRTFNEGADSQGGHNDQSDRHGRHAHHHCRTCRSLQKVGEVWPFLHFLLPRVTHLQVSLCRSLWWLLGRGRIGRRTVGSQSSNISTRC